MLFSKFKSFIFLFHKCITQYLFNRNKEEDQEIVEIPSQEYVNVDPEKRMLRNRRSLHDIMAMKWESDTQVRFNAALSQHINHIILHN